MLVPTEGSRVEGLTLKHFASPKYGDSVEKLHDYSDREIVSAKMSAAALFWRKGIEDCNERNIVFWGFRDGECLLGHIARGAGAAGEERGRDPKGLQTCVKGLSWVGPALV